MITAVVTSDNHLGYYVARLRPERLERRRRRLQEAFACVVDAAIKEQADLFLHAGDLFDRPDPRNADRRFVAEQARRLQEAHIPFFLIAGNHDSPRSPGYDGGVTPHEELEALNAARLFRSASKWDSETLTVRGHRVRVRGLSSDFNLPAEACPLAECALPETREADIEIVLLHYGVEGWGDFPLEPCLSLANLDRLAADAICVGHLHTRNEKRLSGGALLLNPGATEHIRFGEETLDCGYWRLRCAPGRAEAEYVRIPTQPMRTLPLDLSALAEEAKPRPAERENGAEAEGEPEMEAETEEIILLPELESALHALARKRIADASHPDQLLRVRFGGRLPRALFPALDIAGLQAAGVEGNFHCQFETSELALFDEITNTHLEIGFSFDVQQELQAVADALRGEMEDDPYQKEVCRRAGQEVDAAYARLKEGAR